MSKRTFIPQWQPRKAICDPSKRMGSGKYGNNRRRGASGFGPEHGMRTRTLYDAKDKGQANVQWYGTGYGEDEPPAPRNHRLTTGRLTQRIGMFRNAKQSDIVYSGVSSEVRRAVNRDIEQLVAPEDDVEWLGRAPSPRRTQSRSLREHRRRRRSPEDDENGDMDECEKRRRRYHQYVHDRDDNRYEAESRPIRRNLANERDYQSTTQRGAQNGRISMVYSQQMPNQFQTTGINSRHRHPERYRQERPHRHRESSTQDCAMSLSGTDRNASETPCRSTQLAVNERVLRTPNRDDTAQSVLSIVDPAQPVAYPSSMLACRILAGLPCLPLRENDSSRYAFVALDLLSGSIEGQRNGTLEESSDARMMSTLMNQTSRLVADEKGTDEFLDDDSPCAHDYLFRPDSPLVAGVKSTSPPRTPEMERVFNQTMQAGSLLDLEAEADNGNTAMDHSQATGHDISADSLADALSQASASLTTPRHTGHTTPTGSSTRAAAGGQYSADNGIFSGSGASSECSVSSGMDVPSSGRGRSTLDNQSVVGFNSADPHWPDFFEELNAAPEDTRRNTSVTADSMHLWESNQPKKQSSSTWKGWQAMDTNTSFF